MRNNAGRRVAWLSHRVCLVVQVLARPIEYILAWIGEKLCCTVQASQA